jgi:hypothetical protein
LVKIIETIKDITNLKERVSALISDYTLNSNGQWVFINLVSYKNILVVKQVEKPKTRSGISPGRLTG